MIESKLFYTIMMMFALSYISEREYFSNVLIIGALLYFFAMFRSVIHDREGVLRGTIS